MKTYKEIDEEGNIAWVNENGDLHRENGPAFIWYTGILEWYKNGLQHREDGPAVVYNVSPEFIGCEDEEEKDQYFLDDIEYTENEFIKEMRVRKINSFQ